MLFHNDIIITQGTGRMLLYYFLVYYIWGWFKK